MNLRRTALSIIAPIVVVMLPEAQICGLAATFERKAGEVYLQSPKGSASKNILFSERVKKFKQKR